MASDIYNIPMGGGDVLNPLVRKGLPRQVKTLKIFSAAQGACRF
jgi:hypothetical protein